MMLELEQTSVIDLEREEMQNKSTRHQLGNQSSLIRAKK